MEDEIAGRHHQCSGHELGQISGDGEGQGGQACCSPWGHDWVTEQQQCYLQSFPGGSVAKNPTASAGHSGSIP